MPINHLPTGSLPATLPALLRQAAAHWGQRPAVVDGNLTLGFDDILQQT
jgi:non-ribosomal peptide synthetase component E (peptide arylation enzyme)